MQSSNKKQLEKNLYNQSCLYATLEDSLVKVLPQCNVLQTVPFQLRMFSTSTPRKVYMSAVPLQSTSLSLKPCHIYCKSSPTWSVMKGTGYKGRQRKYYKASTVAFSIDERDALGWIDVEQWNRSSLIHCQNMVDWRYQSVNQSVSQSVSEFG